MIPGRPVPRAVGGADATGLEPHVEREAGEDHELVDGVVALDVAGRIGLRIAQILRVDEHVAVGPALLAIAVRM